MRRYGAPVDDQEIRRRGPQLLAGALMITLGGLLALFGTMYGPLAQPEGLGVVSDRARNFATLGAASATLLGLGAGWCYRGSPPMIFASGVVAVAAGYNLLKLLPLY